MLQTNGYGCDLFFSTLPCSYLACLPLVVFVSCCHDVSASHPLLVNELCCLVNWLSIYMSEVLTLVGVMLVDSIYSCRPRDRALYKLCS